MIYMQKVGPHPASNVVPRTFHGRHWAGRLLSGRGLLEKYSWWGLFRRRRRTSGPERWPAPGIRSAARKSWSCRGNPIAP